MFVKYFIPEDGDEQNHPNVFKLESGNQLNVSDIKSVSSLKEFLKVNILVNCFNIVFPSAWSLPFSILEKYWYTYCLDG